LGRGRLALGPRRFGTAPGGGRGIAVLDRGLGSLRTGGFGHGRRHRARHGGHRGRRGRGAGTGLRSRTLPLLALLRLRVPGVRLLVVGLRSLAGLRVLVLLLLLLLLRVGLLGLGLGSFLVLGRGVLADLLVERLLGLLEVLGTPVLGLRGGPVLGLRGLALDRALVLARRLRLGSGAVLVLLLVP